MGEQDVTVAMEDYLEAIYCIGQGKHGVRVKNIASRIGVKMPTVTSMLKSLNDKGFVDYEKHEYLELTPKGKKIGKEINRRHQAIRAFLVDVLGVNSEVADEDACRIEHGVSGETMERLRRFVDFIRACPRTGEDWVDAFRQSDCDEGGADQCCGRLDACIRELKRKRQSSSAQEGGKS